MNLTPTQTKWLADRNIDQSNVLQDETGLYVLVTSTLDGSQTNFYLPQ